MLHIATVHWLYDEWIDVQLNYLRRHITEPFRVYAFLSGEAAKHRSKFFYSNVEPVIAHDVKLNLLAEIIGYHRSSPDDWLMFIDGDAFPVGDMCSYAAAKFREFPLIAIQRKENNGDPQPHPSFCLTTCGFWKRIGGDWKRGFEWADPQGNLVTDVGGNLLQILSQKHIPWYPMLRSNKHDIHPLWFGVYDNIIYHHGAGFREPVSRADRAGKVPLNEALERNVRQSREVFSRIQSDPDFYLQFTG
jgi:hypothetical protein